MAPGAFERQEILVATAPEGARVQALFDHPCRSSSGHLASTPPNAPDNARASRPAGSSGVIRPVVLASHVGNPRLGDLGWWWCPAMAEKYRKQLLVDGTLRH